MFISNKNAFSHLGKALIVLLLSAVSFVEVSCGRTREIQPIPIETVMRAVHEYGAGHHPIDIRSKTLADQASLSADELLNDTDGPYQKHIATLFAQGDFAQLEKEAQKVRADKSRLRGGVWKLFAIYESLGEPSTGTTATSDWEVHFVTLKKWIAAYPESATARIALSQAYTAYAGAARGGGYADTVSQSGWNLFAERTAMAKATLIEAATLKEKCPYWYEAMQVVALNEGWDKPQARELFDQAAAFEPTYYHFYREYANYLLPKWYGEEGETQAFAEEVSSRLTPPDASIIYFEIASLLACQCDKERDSLAGMSWPRVKQGFQDLSVTYGTSNLKLNRFAYMSFIANDQLSARNVFPQIGDDWSGRVWRSAQNFAAARAWATTQCVPPMPCPDLPSN